MRRIHVYLFPALVALLAYFSWSYFYGSRSVSQAQAVKARVAQLETRHEAAKAAREQAESRVRLLRPQSLDPDMLDERARTVLQYVAPQEFIIYNNTFIF